MQVMTFEIVHVFIFTDSSVAKIPYFNNIFITIHLSGFACGQRL